VSLATPKAPSACSPTRRRPASRPSTASGWFYWDFLFDVYTPSLGVDFDNNGIRQDQFSAKTGALNAGWWNVRRLGNRGFRHRRSARFRLSGRHGGHDVRRHLAADAARSFSEGEWVAGASLVAGGFTLRLPATRSTW